MDTDKPKPVILCVGGFSPDSGAGISADIKTCQARGAYGIAATTLLTAQSHNQFINTHPIENRLLTEQLNVLKSDYTIGAVKIGAVVNKEQFKIILESVAELEVSVVIDPVGTASSGGKLSELTPAEFLDELQTLPPSVRQKSLLTPNLLELLVFAGQKELGAPIEESELPDAEQVRDMAATLCQENKINVLVKGGHGDTTSANDILSLLIGELHGFHGERQFGFSTHGSGCRYATAIATSLARNIPMPQAITSAKLWLNEQMQAPILLGDSKTKALGP